MIILIIKKLYLFILFYCIMLIFKICCGQSSVEDLVRQQRSLRVMYAKNPINQQLGNTSYVNGTSHPFAKQYIQPKLEMAANGKYIKFVRPEKLTN